ncbi:MAG: 30S ribosomal protein S6 [bacterium]|nr:30S ribosomal protein S6 [bacterium]
MKSNELKFYECMLIVDSQAKEEDVEKLMGKTEKTVKKHGEGKITEVKKVGLKRLAYPIGHKREGIYYLINLEIDPVSIKEYEEVMKLSNIVLRFLTKKRIAPIPKPEAIEEKKEEIKEEER